MNIVIAGHFDFPRSDTFTSGGSATASRIRHMAVGLTELGHNVHVIPMSPMKPDRSDVETNVWHDYRGIPYYIAGTLLSSKALRSPIKKRKGYFKAYRRGLRGAIRCIDALNRKHRVDAVIGYSFHYFSMHGLIKYCKKKGILAVRDVVEWFGPEHFSGGRLNPQYWDEEMNIHFSLPKSDGIVAISKFLADRFSSQGVKVIRIPAIIDPDEFTNKLSEQTGQHDDTFRLTYLSRSLTWRDTPFVLMHAVQKTLSTGSKIFLNLIGLNIETKYVVKAKQYADNTPQLRNHVKFWGYVPEQKLFELLSNTNAFVLPRLDSQEAKSCFPTRLPEFLLTGKPVIASDVGDISEYLTDNKEAIIVKPDSVEALAEGITKLIRLPDHGKAIGQAGKKKCKKCFNYRTRCEEISNFLQDLISAKK